MHFLRKLKRGYNHSEILAKQIAKSTDIKLEKNLIKKTKYSRQQSTISKKERLQNLEKSFSIAKSKVDIIDNKNFILVDDVIST